jgi:formylglycine-generating enzyme required for sulfatase activity
VLGTADDPVAQRWQLIDGKHWQIYSSAVEAVEVTDAAEGTRGDCAPGMVEVLGALRVDGWGYNDAIDASQKRTCTTWISHAYPERCAHFDRTQWLLIARTFPTKEMHFCIDRYEYPNRRGAYPWIMVEWTDARAICQAASERLCTEAEWTFACEGEEAMPYPYGYDRDADACVVDRPWRPVDEDALSQRTSERTSMELDRLWQGEPSGARPRCRSQFGVYDMAGNVDEWTTSEVPGERPSILKGGYWGPVRDRCRPSTRAHGEDFYFYQQGFRCCADVTAFPR